MNLLLKRKKRGPNTTLGVLLVNGAFHSYVVEDVDHDLVVDCKIKIKGQTAIPVGIYEIKVTLSTRFRRMLPELLRVPCFSGIRIHSGNTHLDTEGCLLPGITYKKLENGNYTVQSSRLAFDPLHKRIVAALNAGDKVTITIVQDWE